MEEEFVTFLHQKKEIMSLTDNDDNFTEQVGEDGQVLVKVPKSRIDSAFNEFRETGRFVDCQFQVKQGIISCHRVILSKYSDVFLELFSKLPNDENHIIIDIPFCLNEESFKDVIDFIYIFSIKVTPKTIADILITSYLYGIEELVAIATDYFLEALDGENVLDITEKFKFSLSNETIQKYPALYQNYLQLIQNSGLFASIIAKKFTNYPRQKIMDKIPTFLVADIMKNLNYETINDISQYPSINDFIIEFIDKFVEGKQLSDLDKECLSKVIDWSDPESYQYFVYHQCDWVTSSISRRMFDKILNMRRNSIPSIENQVSNLKSNSHHFLGVLSLLQLIVSSKGETEVSECNILKSIGTLWNTVKPFNPLTYNFVQLSADTSPPLCPHMSVQNMFVDNEEYYFAHSAYASEDIEPYKKSLKVGITFDIHTMDGRDIHANLRNQKMDIRTPAKKKDKGLPLKISTCTDYDTSSIEIFCSQQSHYISIFGLRISFIDIIGKFVLK